MKRIGLLFFYLLCFNSIILGQDKFKVVTKETGGWRMIFELVKESGELIRQLDSLKYASIELNGDNYGYFAIFGLTDSMGWYAIDANENVLFKVYNTSFGEPSPDMLIENRIRVVDHEGKIGFANSLGTILIKPQFEIASSFHSGKAIIGESCIKVPWEENRHLGDCIHFSIECKKHGYIDSKGKIIKLGDYTFEEIMEEINWKPIE